MEIKTIHTRFHQLLQSFIEARVKNQDDAADILQEVFIRIHTKIGSLTDGEKLQAWIFSIARNAITDYYRKTAKNPTADISEHLIDERAAEEVFDSTKGLDQCMMGFIERLPEEYRDIIIDSEIRGIRQKDLTDKYGLAYPSIRSRVQRGRSRIKEMLLNCCRVELDSRGNVMEASRRNPADGECGCG